MTERPGARVFRGVGVAAAALVLLGLVAAAAGGYRFGRPSSAHSSPYAVDTLLTIGIALYIVAAAVTVALMFWAGLDLRRREATRRQGVAKRRVRMFLLLLGLLALLLVRERLHILQFGGHQTSPGAAGTGSLTGDHHGHRTQPTQFQLVPFLVILAVGLLAVAGFVVAELRRKRRLPRELAAREELAEVLEDTLEALRAEPDPRRAVIGAYARMERLLAARGIERQRAEAPHEYLNRILDELTGGAPAAHRLTSLFERARFSPREVDAAMKDDAIAAIEDLQAQLELERELALAAEAA